MLIQAWEIQTSCLFDTYLSGFLTLNMAFRDFSLESTWKDTEMDSC